MPCKSFSSLEATTNDAAIAVGANAKAAPFESCAKAVCDVSHGSSIRGMDTSLEPSCGRARRKAGKGRAMAVERQGERGTER
eukprot:5662909-Pleurochrysis_carterae.AAC.1